ncbi:MAG: DNA alkylation repair protein [Fuerstiella sp.]
MVKKCLHQAGAENAAGKTTKLSSATVGASRPSSNAIVADVLAQLNSLGNKKMLAHNTMYGAGQNQLGVRLGDIRGQAKKIRTNHVLALELWKTKNVDAQILATLLIMPHELTAVQLERLVKSVTFVHTADWLHSKL